MQTNISVITQDRGFKRYVVYMTSEHDGMVVDENVANGSGYGSMQDPISHSLKPGASVLVIGSTPPSIMEISIDDSDAVMSCMGHCQFHPSAKEVKVGVVGNHLATYKILSASIEQEGLVLKVEGDKLSYTTLTGNVVGGPFSVEGEYIYIVIGNYSEQKVYLDKVGVLDANGDNYVYNPEHWMEETDTIGDITYGVYTKLNGDIVADAMSRCINAMFDQPVVNVTYTSARFVITSLIMDCRNISVLDDYNSIASVLGLRDATLAPSIDITGMEVYATGISRRAHTVAYSDTIVIPPEDIDVNNIGSTLYIVDPVKTVTVEVMSA